MAVVINAFEQKIQRPKDVDERDQLCSGKQKTHTLKRQVAVDEETGAVVDVSESVPGPTADIRLLEQSRLLKRWPEGVSLILTQGDQFETHMKISMKKTVNEFMLIPDNFS